MGAPGSGWIPGLKGRIETLTIDSEVLRGNPLNDPPTRHVLVYLPPEYDSTSQSYPVVACLTGFTGTGRMLLHDTPWRPALSLRLESLEGRGMAGPMILCFPDCFTRLGGSQYMNSRGVGRYEDHIIDELLPGVAAAYRTLDRPRHWGVMGKSSGGYGALRLAMRHPESFGALACHSGDLYFPYCFIPDFPRAARLIERHGDVLGFLKVFHDVPRTMGDYIHTLNIIAMSACYSPKEDDEGFDLPFDIETGRIREGVWKRWLAEDPLNMLEEEKCQRALSGMRLIYLDCGIRDEFNLHFGARMFAARMRQLGIPCFHEEFDDGHFDVAYRYERSLPRLWDALRPS
jgi:enterochelin esterase family protein